MINYSMPVYALLLQDKEYRHYKVEDFDYDDDIATLREDWRFNSSFSVYPMPDDLSLFKVHR